ncbi:glycosyltransferase [Kineococcus sp. SYSU DK004]|uniref:glycosyltransferase n=1 Tax=Kineococcus sp. SYSU DK004 TaxID=3383125 RepID=UPI003D7E809A
MSVEQYHDASRIAGPLTPSTGRVRFRRVLSTRERATVTALGVGHAALVLAFCTYLAWPSHLPVLSGHALAYQVASVLGVVMILGLQVVQLLGTLSTVNFAVRAVDPVPVVPRSGLRVAMLTTVVPSKEPWEVVERTLLKFLDQRYDGHVDAWVLDEGDDPAVRARCAELGIKHFSRAGVPQWNTESGPFRARTKHGNHNAWRAAHEHEYDVVTQMDPDHTPLDSDDFLERVLGYFEDPDVAFVVAPQVYANAERDGIVAKGSAELAYSFHGIVQRGANALGAAVLIGTNHAYRPSAWQQIGGYQDCIIEDHLTAMEVAAAVNPATGNRWRGVYTPDVLTAGEGPSTWTDFFSQQRRWAYGIFEIATRRTPRALRTLSWGQRVSFASLQFFYPSVALTWLMGNALSALYLVGGVSSSRLQLAPWLLLFLTSTAASLAVGFWLRRFNLVEHERRSWGTAGLFLNLVTAPVYLAAGFAQLTGRPLAYKVTAKGRLSSGDSLRTFRVHLLWVVFALACVAVGLLRGNTYPTLHFWMLVTAATCAAPVVVWWRGRRRSAVAVPAPVPARVIDLRDGAVPASSQDVTVPAGALPAPRGTQESGVRA